MRRGAISTTTSASGPHTRSGACVFRHLGWYRVALWRDGHVSPAQNVVAANASWVGTCRCSSSSSWLHTVAPDRRDDVADDSLDSRPNATYFSVGTSPRTRGTPRVPRQMANRSRGRDAKPWVSAAEIARLPKGPCHPCFVTRTSDSSQLLEKLGCFAAVAAGNTTRV